MIIGGAFIVIFMFVRAYKNFVFATDPTQELLELGRRSLRRGSNIIVTGQHRISHIAHRDSYHLLKSPNKYQNNNCLESNKNLPIASSNEDEDSPA